MTIHTKVTAWNFIFLFLFIYCQKIEILRCGLWWKFDNVFETASRGAKWSEICGPGVLVKHRWGIFDTLVFKVIWGSFGAYVSKHHVKSKRLAVAEEKWIKILDSGKT